ncbi:dsRNA-binding [Tanapox virus]|uniref:DsRNA-binding n=1 Tax=Tanapox virus TaxID=99000 RepID=A7XCF0_9POXV|nr:dsRNA-binding [Tanapox virus]ABQ43663.1 dsRNA-binding [Tanapox virus]
MDLLSCTVNDAEIFSLVKKEVLSLNTNDYTTAISLSNKLKIDKKKINQQLYKLKKEDTVKMVPSNPPKWFKNYNGEHDSKLEQKHHIPNHIFSDTVPYKKIINWKDKNPCIVLNEYCQFTCRDWSIDITTSGKSHCPMFTATVIISGIKFKPAIGNTKREAKYNASKITMDEILDSVIIKF